MKAIQISSFGGPEVLVINEIAEPEINEQQLLVEVEATGVNLADTYIRSGAFPGLPAPPFTLGMEGVGTVTAAGGQELESWVGKRVCFAAPQSYAEYAMVDLSGGEPWQFVHEVGEMPIADAAQVGMSARTAMLLFRRTSSQSVTNALVHAAAGGVGSVLVQLLANSGIHVTGLVGSDNKREFVKALGATSVINYREEDVNQLINKKWPQGMDVIFNGSGGKTISRDLNLLAVEGRLIWYGFAESATAPELEQAMTANFMKSVALEVFNAGCTVNVETKTAVAEVVEQVNQGKIKLPVHKIFSFSDYIEAHQDLESGKTTGKTIIRIGES